METKSLQKLIVTINSLPGISKKQAQKIAYYLIDKNEFLLDDLIDSLKLVKKNLRKCVECNNIDETETCSICTSTNREKKLVIVESPLDIVKFEQSKVFKPYYHVLGGLVNISKSVDIDDLNIKNLKTRVKKYKEIIIALSPNLEGIVTANYIKKYLGDKVKVTQLAQGIPLGAAMEYVDEITLKAALDNRKEIK